MCLCDLLMSSTLHYTKTYTHRHTLTQQSLSSKWTGENISDQSFFLALWLLRLHEKPCQRGTRESLARSLTHSVAFPQSVFFCVVLFFLFSDSLHLINIAPCNTSGLSMWDLMTMLCDSLIQEVWVFLCGLCMIHKLD